MGGSSFFWVPPQNGRFFSWFPFRATKRGGGTTQKPTSRQQPMNPELNIPLEIYPGRRVLALARFLVRAFGASLVSVLMGFPKRKDAIGSLQSIGPRSFLLGRSELCVWMYDSCTCNSVFSAIKPLSHLALGSWQLAAFGRFKQRGASGFPSGPERGFHAIHHESI